MIVVTSYLIYLAISVAITIWVAHSLSTNGYRFLVDGFGQDEALARSVNHLLVVGFYLLNLGFVSVALRFGSKPQSVQAAIEFLSTKIGLVLLTVGAVHFFLMKVIGDYRQRARRERRHREHAPNPTLAELAGEDGGVGPRFLKK